MTDYPVDMGNHDQHRDHLVRAWEGDLRGLLVDPIPADRVGSLAMVTVAAVGTSLTASAALAAGGGAAMTASTTITASAGWSLNAKIAAAALAAALAAGGGAAATGSLPDGMQTFVADAAAHVGIEIPRPDARLDAGVDANAVIEVGSAGSVAASLDGSGAIVVTGFDEGAGFTASVVGQTQDSVTVVFESATETATAVLTEVDGTITASITTAAHADADADAGADAGHGSVEGDASLESEIGVVLDLDG